MATLTPLNGQKPPTSAGIFLLKLLSELSVTRRGIRIERQGLTPDSRRIFPPRSDHSFPKNRVVVQRTGPARQVAVTARRLPEKGSDPFAGKLSFVISEMHGEGQTPFHPSTTT